MQENDFISQITEQIKNKELLKNDMQEVLGLVSNLFKTKYIDRLNLEIDNQRKITQQNPSREVVLLQAIKPFLIENSHKGVDGFISTITNVNVMKSLKDKIVLLNEATEEKEEMQETETETETEKIAVIDSEVKISSKNDESSNLENGSKEFKDESIKEDGVYDIDDNCLLSMQSNSKDNSNIFSVLILFMLLFRN